MGLGQHELPPIIVLVRVGRQVFGQSGHQLRDDFRMVPNLKADDTSVIFRGIGNDIRKVSIHRDQHSTQFLSMRDHNPVCRIYGYMIPQSKDFMPSVLKRLDHRSGDAVVGEESHHR